MALHKPSRPIVVQKPEFAPRPGPSPRAAVGWLAGGAVLTFVLSWPGTDVLELQHDLLYLVDVTCALATSPTFAAHTGAG